VILIQIVGSVVKRLLNELSYDNSWLIGLWLIGATRPMTVATITGQYLETPGRRGRTTWPHNAAYVFLKKSLFKMKVKWLLFH